MPPQEKHFARVDRMVEDGRLPSAEGFSIEDAAALRQARADFLAAREAGYAVGIVKQSAAMAEAEAVFDDAYAPFALSPEQTLQEKFTLKEEAVNLHSESAEGVKQMAWSQRAIQRISTMLGRS